MDELMQQCIRGQAIQKPENYQNIMINAAGTLRRDEWKQLDEANYTYCGITVGWSAGFDH